MKKNLILIVAIFLLLWIGSIIKCETLTVRHQEEFTEFEEVSTAYDFKILEYNQDFARVYCINFNRTNGTVHNFKKEDGIWIYNEWEMRGWSTNGSASGVIWPYWWHSIHRGF